MTGWNMLATMAGGVGLFLLGMTMMTDGLKLAAGPALERILANATRTRWHGLGSGVLVTSLVQSSSAVTVATIGFVNAGLLTLGGALWVLFGTNVGTTMTGWIVALIGLKFKVEALALPLIGVGVVMRLTGAKQRRGAFGTALAGFGLLFLGIAMLQQSFTGLAQQVQVPQGTGWLDVLAQVGAGALMTVLMQSSSASMTIALTAVAGGLVSGDSAAAMVIGANIGTTFKAILAAMGATPNAKRAALAHVVFNVVTAAVALAMLPWLVDVIERIRDGLELPADPATSLALFHTCFNVMGVLLMWPMADRLTHWLQGRFVIGERNEARPRHLDDNVLGVPELALKALALEVGRIGHASHQVVRKVLAGTAPETLAASQAVVQQLSDAAQSFVERMSRDAMTQATSAGLVQVLRVMRYHEAAAELAAQAAPLRPLAAGEGELLALQTQFLNQADALLVATDPEPGPAPWVGDQALDQARHSLDSAYEAMKVALLAAGASGNVRLVDMEDLLRRYSALRHATEQSAKAWQRRGQMV